MQKHIGQQILNNQQEINRLRIREQSLVTWRRDYQRTEFMYQNISQELKKVRAQIRWHEQTMAKLRQDLVAA